MRRRLARLALTGVLAASVAGTGMTVVRIAHDPLAIAFRAATAAEIRAETDRMLAQTATPEALTARIEARLAESPRNWLALDALRELSAERGIALQPDLIMRFDQTRKDDHGYLAQAASCAICAFDAARCSLTQVMMCNAPVALTPVGDMLGITRAGVAYASGEEVDRIDLALSVVGLGATAAVIASGGSSIAVKAGAGLAKTARKMGRLSPRLVSMATDAVREGVDWARLPAVRSLDDLNAAIRADAFLPLTNTLADLERVRTATNATTVLHLLPLVDDADDARKLALTSEALGPRLVGRAEMLGKARLFRATLRLGELAWGLFASVTALVLALAGMAGHMGQTLALRLLRRAAAKPKPR